MSNQKYTKELRTVMDSRAGFKELQNACNDLSSAEVLLYKQYVQYVQYYWRANKYSI